MVNRAPQDASFYFLWSKIGNLGRLQLKLELVCNQGNEFGIRGFSLGIWGNVKSPTIS